ncbi:hypothetical protein BG011_000633, partial [Mortierella polycephala]
MTLLNVQNEGRRSGCIKAITTIKVIPAIKAVRGIKVVPAIKTVSGIRIVPAIKTVSGIKVVPAIKTVSGIKVIPVPNITPFSEVKGHQARIQIPTPSRSQSPEIKEKEQIKGESKEQECYPELRAIKTEQQELPLSNDREPEALAEIDGAVRVGNAKSNISKAPLLTPSPTPSRGSSPALEIDPGSETHAKKERDACKNVKNAKKKPTKTKKTSNTSKKTEVRDDENGVKASTEARIEDVPAKQVRQTKQLKQTKSIDGVPNEAVVNKPRLVRPGDAGHMKPYRDPAVQAESADITFEFKRKSRVVFSAARFD